MKNALLHALDQNDIMNIAITGPTTKQADLKDAKLAT